jgi:hypothetical protein
MEKCITTYKSTRRFHRIPVSWKRRAMSTPNSEQAIRIRWYDLWMDRIVIWCAFGFIMKIVKDHLNLCYLGVAHPYNVRSCYSEHSEESWLSKYKIFLPINRDRNDKLNFLDNLAASSSETEHAMTGNRVRFPLRTYGNDGRKELSFRDVFTRNLNNDNARFLSKTYGYDSRTVNETIYYLE